MSGLYLGIASVAIAAGGAVTSGVMADQAGRRQVGAAKGAQRLYQKGLEQIGIFGEQKSPGQLLAEDMPYLTAAAQRSSQTLREEGEKFRPGGQELKKIDVERAKQAYEIIGDYMSNRLPPALEAEITRTAAEKFGAGNIATLAAQGAPGAGMQASGFSAARMLGLGALGLQQQGLTFLGQRSAIEQDWAKIARAYSVGEFEGPAQYALGAGELQQQQMALQLGALTGQYNAMQNVGAADYARGMGQAGSVLQGSQAVAGAMGGMAGGMAQYQQSSAIKDMASNYQAQQLMAGAVKSPTYSEVMAKEIPSISDRPYKVPMSFGASSKNAALVSGIPSAYS
jgi:hypothetical protein